jgi:hypothetical protein
VRSGHSHGRSWHWSLETRAYYALKRINTPRTKKNVISDTGTGHFPLLPCWARTTSMAQLNVSIVWFRRDLRLYDNPALVAALNSARTVIPLYIWAPEEEVSVIDTTCWLTKQRLSPRSLCWHHGPPAPSTPALHACRASFSPDARQDGGRSTALCV